MNDNYSYLDSQIMNVDGGPGGFFNTEEELKAAYPTGSDRFFIVKDHAYWWKNGKWTKTNAYPDPTSGISDNSIQHDKLKGEKKLYSILPKTVEGWNTFKINTTVGKLYSYGDMGMTLESEDNYYYKSAKEFGLSSKKKYVKSGDRITLIGTSEEYITLIEYDSNNKALSGTGWKFNRYEHTCSSNVSYVILIVKRNDNKPMMLEDILRIKADAVSETVVTDEVERIFTDYDYSKISWVQGSYAFINGKPIGKYTYSNYRVSTIIEVNPSTEYELKNNLIVGEKKYRYVVYLIGENDLCLNGSGWVLTKDKVKFRTTPDVKKVMIMFANVSDGIMTKADESILFNLRLKSNSKIQLGYEEITDFVKDSKIEQNLLEALELSDWKQGKVVVKAGHVVSNVATSDRISTEILLEKNTAYLLDMGAPYEFKFKFGHATDKKLGLYDSFWHWGPYRFLTGDEDEFLYINAANRDESKISVDSIIKFKARLTKTSLYNQRLDTTTTGKLIMHRGAMEEAPENSIPAFREVAKFGAWATEMDVQYTKDKVAIILHDDTVDGMTDGTGKVKDLTLAQIKELTIDSGANIDKYPGLKVPTLEEAIKSCKRYGVMPVLDCGTPLATKEGTELLIHDLKRLGIEQTCIVLTQSTTTACNFRYYNHETPMIAQYSGNINAELEINRLYRYPEAYYGGWNLYKEGATEESLERLWAEGHKRQMQFYALTTDKKLAEKWFDLGCDFMCSDDLRILDYE